MRYICNICGYAYDEDEGDPSNGVPAGTKWADVPDDYTCPVCGVEKSEFSPEE